MPTLINTFTDVFSQIQILKGEVIRKVSDTEYSVRIDGEAINVKTAVPYPLVSGSIAIINKTPTDTFIVGTTSTTHASSGKSIVVDV